MKKPSTDNLAGILITVSIHLAVIIVLLLTVVTPNIKNGRERIEIDFSEQEKIEELERQLAKAKALNDKINRMLEEEGVDASSPKSSDYRNIQVDANLKDDRGTDAEQLYKDAERIQKEYEENMAFDENSIAIPSSPKQTRPQTQDQVYTGPSVLSYQLEGRKGSYLPIPAYQCIAEGEVTVIVTVNPNGDVIGAKIQEDISSTDQCLKDYALKAAKRSRFSKSTNAPSRQVGNIVYQFIAQ